MTAAVTYARYELLRALRNRRFYVFSLGFPLALFWLIAGPNSGEKNLGGTGIPASLYFMVGMTAFGTMNAVVAGGARIALERQAGWQRQLRVTPLRTPTYFATKVLVGYLSATLTIAALYVAGIALGVSLPIGEWVAMTALILVGLLPFAALGVVIGHLVTADSIGPVMGGITALLAFLGGVWFPLGSGTVADIGRFLPSYWLVQAGHVSLGGAGWGLKGWLVVAGWTALLAVAAAIAYGRDTKRA
jgi:ABC-2 type transport system permease protein